MSEYGAMYHDQKHQISQRIGKSPDFEDQKTQLLLLAALFPLRLAKAPIMQMQLSAWRFVSHAQAVGASRSGEDHEIDNEVAIDRSKEPPNGANDLIKVEVCDKT